MIKLSRSRLSSDERKKLVAALEMLLDEFAMDVSCDKMEMTDDDTFYADGVEAIERLLKRPDYDRRIQSQTLMLDSRPRASRALKRKWAKRYLQAARSQLKLDPNSVDAHADVARALMKTAVHGEGAPAAAFRRLFSFHEKAAARFTDKYAWTTWLWHLAEGIKQNADGSRRIARRSLESLRLLCRRLYTANKLSAFTMAAAFKELRADKGLPNALQQENIFWLGECLGARADRPDPGFLLVCGDLFYDGYLRFKQRACLARAVECYEARWECLPGDLYSLIKAKAELARVLRSEDPEASERLIVELLAAAKKTISIYPDSLNTLCHALEFVKEHEDVLAARDGLRSLAELRLRWSLACEKAGDGYYGTPYQQLVDCYAILGDFERFEYWCIRYFLRLSIYARKDFESWAKNPRVMKYRGLKTTFSKLRKFYDHDPQNFSDGGVPMDELRKLDLHGLRLRLDAYLAGRRAPVISQR